MLKRIAFVFISMVLSAPAFAYQVTGPVLEVTDSKIVVQKGKDKWEVMLDGATKLAAKPAVGDKVTIEYTMTATDVAVKTAKKK